MNKLTKAEMIIKGMNLAWGEMVEKASKSKKYRCFERQDGAFFWVGKCGALRKGKTVSESFALPDAIKNSLLKKGGAK